MYLTLLVIFLIIFIVGMVWLAKEDWYSDGASALVIIGALGLFIFSIFCIISFASIQRTERTVDSRIELYEIYNVEIKAQVDAVSMQYLDHESDLYSNFNSAEVLFIIPELHSNTIIMEQIALYEANESKILELREKRIDLSFEKFMLYWGK